MVLIKNILPHFLLNKIQQYLISTENLKSFNILNSFEEEKEIYSQINEFRFNIKLLILSINFQ
jgi:hypothetical protein